MLDVNCAHKNILSIEVSCYDRLKYADDGSEHKKNKAHKSVTVEQQFSAKDSKILSLLHMSGKAPGQGDSELKGLGKLEAVLGPHFRRNALTSGLYIT